MPSGRLPGPVSFEWVVCLADMKAASAMRMGVTRPTARCRARRFALHPTHNSSLGRLGLLTHSTAGFIDPGFSGRITLELSNVANLPITLWPGMKIGQLCLFRLSSAAQNPYGSAAAGSRYQGQRGPTPSRSYVNFRRWPTS